MYKSDAGADGASLVASTARRYANSAEGELSTWPGAEPTAEKLLQRYEDFFFGQPDGPIATGDGGVARKESLALCATVRPVVATLWKIRADDIKALAVWREYDPPLIDEQEVFAYCIVDTLGKSLLCKEDARLVGTRGYNAVKKEMTKVAAARKTANDAVRAARRAAAADPSKLSRVAAAETAGELAVAKVHESKYDLAIPQRTVGAKRKVEPAPEPAPKRLGLLAIEEHNDKLCEQMNLEKAQAILAADDEFTQVAAAYDTACTAYVQVLRIPFHDDWNRVQEEASDAWMAARELRMVAREARLAPLREAFERAKSAADRMRDDWRPWAFSERGKREADRLQRECTHALDAYSGMQMASLPPILSQEIVHAHSRWSAWFDWWMAKQEASAAKREARFRARCGCVCEAHCCLDERDCRACLIGRRRGNRLDGYMSE